MKILIIANDTDGLINFRGKLIEELSHKFEVIAASPKGGDEKQLKQMGVQLINIDLDRRGINPINDMKLFLEINRILRKEKPDNVITYTIKPNIYGGFACILNGVNYSANITGLGTAFERSRVLKTLVSFMYRLGLFRAKTVFFENNENKNTFVVNKIIPESKAIVLHGAGVDLEKFYYQDYPRNESFVFLFIGRIMKEKGIEELLQATKMLISDGKKVELHILGGFEEDYIDIIQKCQDEGWLKYFGICEDVRPYIKSSDCFVLPSYHEGMANTNLECAASGRPIITSNIPGCREAVTEESGLLCEPKDVNSLYNVMLLMTDFDREKREKMGKKGHEHMKMFFDKRKVVEETIRYI